MELPEGVLGVEQVTRRLVSDSEETPGLPGAPGGSPEVWHPSVTVKAAMPGRSRLTPSKRQFHRP